MPSPARSSVDRDDVIRREYAKVAETADQIVEDPTIGAEFMELVNSQLPQTRRFDAAELNHRLLNLRRRGEANGGLVKKQRKFGGRKCSPR